MFGFKIYYRKKRIRISVRANISGTLLTTFKKLFRHIFGKKVRKSNILTLRFKSLGVGKHSIIGSVKPSFQ